MIFQTSPLYEANLNTTADVVVNQGGTSSGKTYSIMQVLFTIAMQENNALITVVGQDFPNLKVGALRDAQNIIRDSPVLQSVITKANKSTSTYEFATGSVMEFMSYDDWQDAKSGKRDYLFINEANGIPYNMYCELALRTRKRIYIDYNPNSEFWVHREVLGRPTVQLIVSDHRHNPFLSQKTRDKIEALAESDTELWRVYARGLTGKVEGLVFRNYAAVPALPDGGTFVGYGMDFGFTNDPTTLVEVWKQNGELWINELIYETGLTNQDISERMKLLGIPQGREITADSAEPKSIEELNRLGWNVRGANKGQDSIRNSIDILKRYKLNLTQRSHNLRREVGGYRWKTNKNGTLENVPVDANNHTIDALRYVALNKLSENVGKGKYTVA